MQSERDPTKFNWKRTSDPNKWENKYTNEKPTDPTGDHLGKTGTTLSWGYWDPPGGAPRKTVAVLSDTPQLIGEADDAARLVATLEITVTNKIGGTEVFEYQVTSLSLPGQAARFEVERLK